MHNIRFFDPLLLSPKFVPEPSIFKCFDQLASEGINWDEGGLWEPETPIIIGGSGVTIANTGGFTGGVKTGARAPDGAMLLADNDWPRFSSPRTRTVLFPIGDYANSDRDRNEPTVGTSFIESAYDQSVPGSVKANTNDQADLLIVLDPKKFIPDATIVSVTVRFSVGIKPASIPASLPNILFSDAISLVDDSAVLPTPANVNAYYNGGLPQDFVLPIVNNATVTVGKNYFINLNDRSATRNVFHSISIAFSNMNELRPGL